jgi:hypothetical protein
MAGKLIIFFSIVLNLTLFNVLVNAKEEDKNISNNNVQNHFNQEKYVLKTMFLPNWRDMILVSRKNYC